MSVSTLRSAITGLFMAAAPLVSAQAEETTPPDMAQTYVALCTAHKGTYESVMESLPAEKAQDLLDHYKDLNRDYAEKLKQGGYDPSPCLGLG